MSAEDVFITEVCKMIGQLDNLRIWKARMLAVKPGEILVIQLPNYFAVSEQAKERYAKTLTRKLGIERVLIIDASVGVHTIRRIHNFHRAFPRKQRRKI